MKAVILAGGLGTRLSEETGLRPKPMIEVGGKPLLWHIMTGYHRHGVSDFVICCGYKGYVIKEFFKNYAAHVADIRVELATADTAILAHKAEPWTVTMIDTGENTMTGGRLRRVAEYVRGEDAFCFTYGDGLSNIDISAEVAFHRSHGKLATVAAVQPPGRYGALQIEPGDKVSGFVEKPRGDGGLINGGFFVLDPRVIDYIDADSTMWEHEPLTRIAEDGELMAFRHDGFWQPMDTLRDKLALEQLWNTGSPPWLA